MGEATASDGVKKIRTSELIAQDGMEVVGDSTRRMTILEDAQKKGNLIKDGTPSDKFEKIKRILSGKITS